MAGSKEIRNKIKSVQSTRKITKAMEMVAASKMKKAQDRMRASRPYVQRTLQIAMHVAKANTEYKHPFLARRAEVKRVGVDRRHHRQGPVRRPQHQRAAPRAAAAQGVAGEGARGRLRRASAARASGFLNRLGANVVSSAVQLGDRPRLDRLVGPVKVLFDKYIRTATIDEVHIFFTNFVNTMKQVPRHATDGCRSPRSSARSTASCARPRRPPGRGTTSTSPTPRRCSTACCAATSRRSSTRWSTRTWPPSSRRGWSR